MCVFINSSLIEIAWKLQVQYSWNLAQKSSTAAAISQLTFHTFKFTVKTAKLKLTYNSSAVVYDIFTKYGNPTQVILAWWDVTCDKMKDGSLHSQYFLVLIVNNFDI